MNRLQKIWKDPVWSKVIAAGLIFIISQIPVVISSIISNQSISQIYNNILLFLTSDCIIPCWIFILIIIVSIGSLVFGLKILRNKNNIEKLENEVVPKPKESDNNTQIEENELRINEAPTVFYHYRFCEAFPGFNNGYKWFTKNKDINTRLSILLKHPTRFKKADGHGITNDPVWWFRGSSAMPIDSIKIIGCNKILLNYDELKIEKIAAYRGRSYYQDFVYVQCLPDKPIGIYNYDKEYMEECLKNNRNYTEDFGLYKGKILTRQEYDDGAAVIKGKPQSISGAELRTRFLTKYNFIIAAKYSPYNCDEFYKTSDGLFGGLLKSEVSFDDFINGMKNFEKNRNDY